MRDKKSLRVATVLIFAGALGCSDDRPTDTETETSATGDGDPGDGDGDPGDGDPGDGDGDPGDGDGDPGDGDPGDGDPGDGDGDPASCGDGNVDAGEECDDANMDDTDACTNACTIAVCGDGVTYAGVEECDDANADNTDDCVDTCALATCGDGYLWAGNEECDDGNLQSYDGCDDDCTTSVGAKKFVSGYEFTCALFWDGQVKCWGRNHYGQLGYGNTDTIGDDETPDSVGFVDVGGVVEDIGAGIWHVCAVMDDASLTCWGYNSRGQLGYGGVQTIGDDELPSSAGAVDVGDDVVAVVAGEDNTCVLTDQQTVRCWGFNNNGQLGLGHTTTIGVSEPPSSVGPVDLGDDVVDLVSGQTMSCALLAGGGVRCWGWNGNGQLGQGHTERIGDDEVPGSVPVVSLGNTPIVDIVAGRYHACVLHDDATMRCWGDNQYGQLGYGNTVKIGDNELPSSVGTVNVGGPVDEIWANYFNTCARVGVDIKCWGDGTYGVNGQGHTQNLGNDELPASIGFIDVGFDVTSIASHRSTMGRHICARNGDQLRCWGRGDTGQLGLGDIQHIGDDELPSAVGVVPYI